LLGRAGEVVYRLLHLASPVTWLMEAPPARREQFQTQTRCHFEWVIANLSGLQNTYI